MKINRLAALGAIALMVVAALGLITARTFAQPAQASLHQAAVRQAAANKVAVVPASARRTAGSKVVLVQIVATATPTENPANNQTDQQGDQTTGQTGGPEATEPASSATEAAGAVEPTEAAGTGGTGETGGGPEQHSPTYTGSITVTESATGANLSETAEAAALASQAKITADQANAAAVAANPGATVEKTDLGDENGSLIYSVELSNGSEVKVDAGNAKILPTDTGGEH